MASNQETPAPVVAEAAPPTCMESVNRIAKLPAVEQTIQTVHGIYEKVKDFNSVTNWTLQTAEDTVHKAVEVGKPYATPVIEKLEGPIKKVDGVLCSGLDYVETKVPAVKLPPKELILQIYNTTKDYVSSHVSPAVETAKHIAEPAVNTAKGLIEPVVENVRHKVDEYLHKNPEQPESEQDNKPSEPKEKPAPKPSKKQS